MFGEINVTIDEREYRFTEEHLEIAEGLTLYSAARRYALSLYPVGDMGFDELIYEGVRMHRTILNLIVADYIRQQRGREVGPCQKR